jgi:hypothetical protein
MINKVKVLKIRARNAALASNRRGEQITAMNVHRVRYQLEPRPASCGHNAQTVPKENSRLEVQTTAHRVGQDPTRMRRVRMAANSVQQVKQQHRRHSHAKTALKADTRMSKDRPMWNRHARTAMLVSMLALLVQQSAMNAPLAHILEPRHMVAQPVKLEK